MTTSRCHHVSDRGQMGTRDPPMVALTAYLIFPWILGKCSISTVTKTFPIKTILEQTKGILSLMLLLWPRLCPVNVPSFTKVNCGIPQISLRQDPAFFSSLVFGQVELLCLGFPI